MSCNQHSYYRLNAAGLFAMITSHKYPQRISSIGWKGCAKPRCALQGGSCDETIARDLLLRPACHISPFPDRSFAPMGAYGNLQNQIAKGVGSFLPALGTVLASQASQGLWMKPHLDAGPRAIVEGFGVQNRSFACEIVFQERRETTVLGKNL